MSKYLRPSPALIVAMVALIAAMGGTSYAAATLAKNSVGSKQIRKAAVKRADLAKNAVTSAKVKNGSLAAADFKAGQLPAGPAGPAGPIGPKGETGPVGPIGPSNAFVAADDTHPVGLPASSHVVVIEELAAGDYVFTASASIENTSGTDATYECAIITSVGQDHTERLGVVRATLADNEFAPISVTGATHTDGGTAELNCSSIDGGDFATVTDARLISTKVGSVQ